MGVIGEFDDKNLFDGLPIGHSISEVRRSKRKGDREEVISFLFDNGLEIQVLAASGRCSNSWFHGVVGPINKKVAEVSFSGYSHDGSNGEAELLFIYDDATYLALLFGSMWECCGEVHMHWIRPVVRKWKTVKIEGDYVDKVFKN